MTDSESPQPTVDRTPVAGVSRRFSVAHMMVGVTLFALLFSSLQVLGVHDFDSSWIIYASCALFCAAVPLGQALLYQGREPRRASCLVGARLLPAMVLAGMLAIAVSEFLADLRLGFVDYQEWGAILLLMLFLPIAASGVGYLAGYGIGTISAGVFLVVDRNWNAGRRTPDGSNDVDTGDEVADSTCPTLPTGRWWFDWIAWSPMRWIWEGRRHPWRSAIFVAAVVGVLFLVSLVVTTQVLPPRYWFAHLVLAVVATPIVGIVLPGIVLPGIFRAGWRVSLCFCALAVMGCIAPFCLLTQTWIWRQIVLHNLPIVRRAYWEIVEKGALAGLVVGIVVTGIVLGLFAAGLCGWTRSVLNRKEKPTGRGAVVVFAVGLVTALVAFNVAAVSYVYSPRERAIRNILVGGGNVEGRLPFSVDYVEVDARDAASSLFQDLGALADVQDLQIYHATISEDDVQYLGQLRNLLRLSFYKCRFPEEALSKLPTLASLDFLSFDECNLTPEDLEVLGRCPSLSWFSVAGETLEGDGLRHLADMPNLVRVTMYSCEVRGDVLKHFRRIPEVRFADVSLSAEELSHLAGATEIQRFSLFGATISADGFRCLGTLKDLKILAVRETDISDADLADLKDLEKLMVLDLGLSAVTDEGLARLPALPALTRLSLQGTRVTAKGLAHLKRLPRLSSVDLAECDLGDEAVEPLRRVNSVHLNLHGTRMSDEAKALLFFDE